MNTFQMNQVTKNLKIITKFETKEPTIDVKKLL